MWLFPCEKPRPDEYNPSEKWRVVEWPGSRYALQRLYLKWRGGRFGPMVLEEWRDVAGFGTIEECWQERHRIRLEEGSVIHCPPDDAPKANKMEYFEVGETVLNPGSATIRCGNPDDHK